jgi:hypothetical protein
VTDYVPSYQRKLARSRQEKAARYRRRGVLHASVVKLLVDSGMDPERVALIGKRSGPLSDR